MPYYDHQSTQPGIAIIDAGSYDGITIDGQTFTGTATPETQGLNNQVIDGRWTLLQGSNGQTSVLMTRMDINGYPSPEGTNLLLQGDKWQGQLLLQNCPASLLQGWGIGFEEGPYLNRTNRIGTNSNDFLTMLNGQGNMHALDGSDDLYVDFRDQQPKRLYGGRGNNRFTIINAAGSAEGGMITVAGFNPVTDQVTLNGFALEANQFQQQGSDTVVYVNGFPRIQFLNSAANAVQQKVTFTNIPPVAPPVLVPYTPPAVSPVVPPMAIPVSVPMAPMEPPLPPLTPSVIPESMPVSAPVETPTPVSIPVAQPVEGPIAAPIAPVPAMAPMDAPQASPVIAPVEQPIAQPEPISEPITSPEDNPVTNPESAPIASPVHAPQTSPVVEPIQEPMSEPMVSPETVPEANPTISPEAMPVTTPSTAPEDAPVSAPMLPPVMQPVQAPSSINPVATPYALPAPTAMPVSAPITPPSQARPAPVPVLAQGPHAVVSSAHRVSPIDGSLVLEYASNLFTRYMAGEGVHLDRERVSAVLEQGGFTVSAQGNVTFDAETQRELAALIQEKNALYDIGSSFALAAGKGFAQGFVAKYAFATERSFRLVQGVVDTLSAVVDYSLFGSTALAIHAGDWIKASTHNPYVHGLVESVKDAVSLYIWSTAPWTVLVGGVVGNYAGSWVGRMTAEQLNNHHANQR